jgi:competence protein ComFC
MNNSKITKGSMWMGMYKSTGIQPISWNEIRFLPIKLTGIWESGYALSFHIKSSEYLGVNQFGREEFDTKRTKIGEMVYQLKYKDNLSFINTLAGLSAETIQELLLHKYTLDCILPIPPSNENRKKQPVKQVAKKVSEILGILYDDTILVKSTHTDQMKNVPISERSSELKNVFNISKDNLNYKNILLFDDLYETGSTASECVKTLKLNNNNTNIFLITLTKTGRY